jgi:hypothetical protein
MHAEPKPTELELRFATEHTETAEALAWYREYILTTLADTLGEDVNLLRNIIATNDQPIQ